MCSAAFLTVWACGGGPTPLATGGGGGETPRDTGPRPLREIEDGSVYERTPIELLDALMVATRRHAWITFTEPAPAEWLTTDHVPALLERFGSSRPCAFVLTTEAVPPFDQRGTEGELAAYLVACARLGRFPAGTGATDPELEVDPDDLRAWWARIRSAMEEAGARSSTGDGGTPRRP